MKIIIVGAGEVGYHIASRLAVENKDVVLIDKKPEAIRRVSENIDVQVLQGSGSSPAVLKEAGIKEAEILLAVTNSDEANLVACLAANLISPSTKKLIRLRDMDFEAYHEVFRDQAPHIDTIINPTNEAVKTIDHFLSVPGAVDIEDFAEGRVKLIGIHLDEGVIPPGVKLMDLAGVMNQKPPLIAAVVRGDTLIIPRGNDSLMPGDLVYFISEGDKVQETIETFGKRAQPVRRVMIIGGGRMGLRLAQALEKKNLNTKIVEKSGDRCTFLAESLNKTIVLHGDGSDQRLLREENVQDMDVVVTLTNDEETNILSSLLSKRMGAKKTITKISKFSYFPLVSAIGLEQVVSTRLSAVNSILRHIRRGKVLSAKSIKGEQAEVLEAVALETSDIVGKPLQNIRIPKGALITAIIRQEEIIIPSGKSVIEPDDRIIIFALSGAIQKIEKILTVKLEYF